ncbi:hypothetical protein SAMN04488503_1289 [Humidesulfovibrio mexicanus]|uniref:Uncharacterized protein n=1 Tax=Humidesulfovibrio mexicanus TaxID=147047 RepID=A0A238Z6Q5_9BACT|nr:hypothetical protein [Humidesulfovibrio mexicanus]SNR78910.1 hypothetical protein SAMN04488503_1289 [Humidesulfovibrio mexicanus]
MPNYKPMQTYVVNKLDMEVHPFAAAPENRFEQGVALQYGADFKIRFRRQGEHKDTLGLLQLIFPQTQIFQHTQPHAWNVDKQALGQETVTMAKCLYGNDATLIGAHSAPYQGQHMRSLGTGECWLIDTPREISGAFANGVFTGQTSTKFANYVVELSGADGRIFNQGAIWGYSVVQNGQNLDEFDWLVQPPREVRLRDTNEHLDAIARFLGLDQTTEEARKAARARIAGMVVGG